MAGPTEEEADALLTRCVAEGHAMLSLSLLDAGYEVEDRDRALLNTAVIAGVMGAMNVLRGEPE